MSACTGVVDQIIDKHEILHTNFIEKEGQIYQIIREDRKCDFEFKKIQEIEIASYVESESKIEFNLSCDKLLRFKLLQSESGKYILFCVIHHIIFDGWSKDVFFKELENNYEGTIKKELNLQYKNFAIWQKSEEFQNLIAEQENYWKNELREISPIMEMPLSKKRPKKRSYIGGKIDICIDMEFVKQVERCAVENNASFYMVLMGIIQSFFARYTNNNSITIGIPIANRNNKEIEGLIGYFVNTLPIKIEFSDSDNFVEILKKVRQKLLLAYDNQDIPFEKIVDLSGVERNLAATPIFQVMFVYQNASNEKMHLGKCDVVEKEISTDTSKYDLLFNLKNNDGRYILECEYSADLYTGRIVNQYVSDLMEWGIKVLQYSESEIMRLECISEAQIEKQKQMNLKTVEGIPKDYLHQLVEKIADKYPNKTAIISGEEKLTYREVVNAFYFLAFQINEKISDEEHKIVGIACGRSIETIISMLAVSKAGGIYVNIDLEYPLDRIKYIINDAAVNLLIVNKADYSRLFKTAEISISLLYPIINKNTFEAEIMEIQKRNEISHYIYTSGSTGKPKGTIITHSNVVSLCKKGDFLRLSDSDVFAQGSSVSFDASTFEIWMPLLNACTISIIQGNVTDIENWEKNIKKDQITIAWLTAGLFNSFVESGIECFGQLRYLLTGGDKLSPNHVKSAIKKLPTVQIINGYGPTETTTFACTYKICGSEEGEIPIGRPLRYAEVYVLNSKQKFLPQGTKGELYIGGAGVSGGYLHNKELTNSKFVDNPYSSEKVKLYRTGDIVRWDQNENLEFCGRLDNQIKLRGFRIELDEIENVCKEICGVNEVTSKIMEDDGNKKLVLYYTGSVEPFEVQKDLKKKLPRYMLPHYFQKISNFPLNKNGKIDKKSLPDIQIMSQEKVEATNSIEAELLSIWKNTIKIDNIGIDDNFFEIGGDSILSIQIVARAKSKKIFINTRQIFEYQTVRELAKIVKNTQKLEKRNVDDRSNILTPIQKWFFGQNFKQRNHWNQSMEFISNSEIDIEILVKAFQFLYDEHSSLRTIYLCNEEGYFRQVSSVNVEDIIDIYELEEEMEEAWEEIKMGSETGLDILKGPLSKIDINILEDGRIQLFWVIHHLAIDGVSWRILQEDLLVLYSNIMKGNKEKVIGGSMTYGEWANILEEHKNNISNEVKNYWLSIMEKDKSLGFGNDNVIEKDIMEKSVKIEKEITDKLLNIFIKKTGLNVEETLLGVVGQTVHEIMDKKIVWFTMEGHGREEFSSSVDITRTVGWFTSMYPLGVEVGTDILDTLVNVHVELYKLPEKGFDYQLISTEIMEKSKPEISFNYLGIFNDSEDKNLTLSVTKSFPKMDFSDESHRVHQIEFVPIIKNGNLIFNIFYNNKNISKNTMDYICTEIVEKLRKLVMHNPDSSEYEFLKAASQYNDKLKYTEFEDVRKLFSGSIQKIMKLTPLQKGMVIQTLKDQENGDYIVQWYNQLDEYIDIDRFCNTWNTLINEYDILTAGYITVGENLCHVVSKGIKMPFEELDWQMVKEEELDEKLDEFLKKNRKQGFKLTVPPLMRGYLIDFPDKKKVFVLEHHHVLLDGWSMPLLFERFNELYNSKRRYHAKDRDGQFNRYINWINSQNIAEGIEKWREYLGGVEKGTLIFRDDTPGKGIYKKKSLILSELCYKKLKNQCLKNRVTLNTLMQFTTGLLLKIFIGQNDIVFGNTVSGRNIELSNVGKIIGPLINTLPIRINFNKKYSDIYMLLSDIQWEQQKMEGVGYCSLTDIENLAVNKRVGKLFDVLYVYENYPSGEGKGNPLDFKTMKGKEQTGYPLGISVESHVDNMVLDIIYNENIFDTFVINQMLKGIKIIFEGIIDGNSLDEIIARMYSTLLPNYGSNQEIYTGEMASLIEKAFRENLERTCIVISEREYSYGQILQKVNQIGQIFTENEKQCIAVATENRLLQICSMLAILKNNCTYVPIDISLPQNRIENMKYDADVSISINGSFDNIKIEKTEILNRNGILGSRDIAYIIYTSGSTGKPKGVAVTYRNLVNRLIGLKEIYQMNREDRIFQNISFCFDPSIAEVLLPILTGASIYLSEERLLGKELEKFLINNNINSLTLTPSLLAEINEDALNGVEKLYVGGEKLSKKLFEKYIKNHKIFNLYGPTETTITAIAFCSDAQCAVSTVKSVPIGKPLKNTYIYVMSPDGYPLPQGMEGELYIGGIGVAAGYVNNIELTGEYFIKNLIDNKCETLYKTGDIVKVLSDGNIEFLNRNDNQVKIRGFRIELEEIRNCCMNLSDVINAIAVIDDKQGIKNIVLYYCGNVEERLVREYLLKHLPSYMMPTYIEKIKAFPVTQNGKIDIKQLPQISLPSSNNDFEGSEEERKLLEIWKELLGDVDISIGSDFFEVGGNSLLAVRLSNLVQSRLGMELTIKEIFEYPTITEQLSLLLKKEKNDTEIIQRIDESVVEASYGQEQFWFYYKMNPQSTLYNVPFILEIEQEIDIKLFEDTYKKIVEKHEILQTNFYEDSGKIMQCIRNNRNPYWHFRDLSKKEKKDEELQIYVNSEVDYVFNLESESLIRLSLIRMDKKRYVVLCVQHHIITDAWSMKILLEEFRDYYNQIFVKKPFIQYKDFSAWQKRRDFSKQLDFWKRELSGELPVLALPIDFKRPEIIEYTGGIVTKKFDSKILEKLYSISKIEKISVFNFLLALYQSFLQRYTNQDEVIVGLPVSNRGNSQIENTVGYFVNTIAVRNEYVETRTFLEFASHVQNKMTSLLENQEVPFDRVVDMLQITRELNRTPIFQTVFSIDNLTENNKMTDIITRKYSNYDLSLKVIENNENMVMEFEYNNQIFSKKTIEKMLDTFNTWIEKIVNNPEQKLMSFEIIGKEEVDKQIHKWNSTEFTFNEQNVLEGFAHCANKYPEKKAIIAEHNITYGELNELSDKIAAFLQNNGCKKGDRIAILTKRNSSVVICMLGVLKAGCVFLPIDCKLPQERIKYMLEDSEAKFSIVDRNDWPVCKETRNVCIAEMIKEQEGLQSVSVEKEDIAYIIYTSGSTGKPKGVQILHKGLNNFCQSLKKNLQINSESKGLQIASISFDASVWEIFPLLVSGGEIHMYTDQDYGEDLIQYINDKGITHCIMTPALYANIDFSTVESLRYLVTGGAKYIANPTVRDDIQIVNAYGPTEATVCAAMYQLKNDCGQEVPIGKALDNVKLFVLGKHYQVLPIGVQGELYIGGEGISIGYLNNEALNHEVFIRNPYCKDEFIYKTGDIVSYLPDGNLMYHGRVDEQIKIRGFRIELGEIETCAVAVEGVSHVAAVVKLYENKKALLLYYTGNCTRNDIQFELEKNLPEYMLPNEIIQIDKMPMSNSGKIDKANLPDIEIKQVEKEKPETSGESEMLKIWQEVLENNNIGVEDNFFECGGDSILSIQVVSAAKKRGISVKTKDIFKYQTIRRLMKNVEKNIVDNKTTYKLERKAFLTPIQKWFFNQHFHNMNHWNQSMAWKVEDMLDEKIFKKTISKISEIHDCFHSCFVKENGEWICCIKKADGNIFSYYDLTMDKNQSEKMLMIEEQAQSSLDIQNGIVGKAILFKTAKTRYRFFWCIHHLVVDGVSWRILIDEVEDIYHKIVRDGECQKCDTTMSYQEWGKKVEVYARKLPQNVKGYWEKKEKTFFYPLYSFEGQTEQDGIIISQKLDKDFTEKLLEKISREFGGNIESVLLGIIVEVFGKILNQDNLWILLEGHGRAEEVIESDLSKTVGWFTNLYPVRFCCTGSIIATIKGIQNEIKSVPNKGFDYQLLSNRKCLLNSMISFNYLGVFSSGKRQKMFINTEVKSTNVSKDNKNPNLLDVVAQIENGELEIIIFTKVQLPILLEEIFSRIRNQMDFLLLNQNAEMKINTYAEIPIEDVEAEDIEEILSMIDLED